MEIKILDPDNTLKWSPTMYLRYSNHNLQQLWTSMMPDGAPLSEWRYIETKWSVGNVDPWEERPRWEAKNGY